MPSFDRRGFLHLLGAASVTPLLPVMPARAAPASVSVSKALWAGIHAQSGSAAKFVEVARGMGLSNAAIQGVGARSVGVRIAAAAVASPISPVAGTSKIPQPSMTSLRTDPWKPVRKIMRDLDQDVAVETGDIDASGHRDATGRVIEPVESKDSKH